MYINFLATPRSADTYATSAGFSHLTSFSKILDFEKPKNSSGTIFVNFYEVKCIQIS